MQVLLKFGFEFIDQDSKSRLVARHGSYRKPLRNILRILLFTGESLGGDVLTEISVTVRDLSALTFLNFAGVASHKR